MAARWAQVQAEKKAAFEKYQPFRDSMPMDDVLSLIRQQDEIEPSKVKQLLEFHCSHGQCYRKEKYIICTKEYCF